MLKSTAVVPISVESNYLRDEVRIPISGDGDVGALVLRRGSSPTSKLSGHEGYYGKS